MAEARVRRDIDCRKCVNAGTAECPFPLVTTALQVVECPVHPMSDCPAWQQEAQP